MSLKIGNLSVFIKDKQILKDINLEVEARSLHAIMGPNGSGKSTLAQALMGNENYACLPARQELRINGKDIKNTKTDERGRLGLFLAFQNPVGIPGVTVAQLLRTAYQLTHKDNKKGKAGHNPALSVWKFNEMLLEYAKKLGIAQDFLRRGLNETFSGGEKKKLEMLQAIVLTPAYAIFDEIDTGLDVDALKIVAKGIDTLKRNGTGVIVITHYQRILKYARPDFVHILVNGKIVESGKLDLAKNVEKNGYKKWISK